MKILIPVDGSPYSDAALRFVATRRFREGQRPQIDLLNVQLPIPPRAGRAVGAEIVRAMHEAESAKVLKPAVSLLRAAQLEPAWQYRVGSPALEIVEWAEAHGSDLIVIGSHGHTAIKALVFGSVTQKVLASTHVPMLTLRAAKPPRRASLRVGIALDGSAYGIAAARYVLAHLPLFGPRPAVTLIHVAEPTAAEALDRGQPNSSGDQLSSAALARVLIEQHADDGPLPQSPAHGQRTSPENLDTPTAAPLDHLPVERFIAKRTTDHRDGLVR